MFSNLVLQVNIYFVRQCHGLSIEGFVLPSSTTREVRGPLGCPPQKKKYLNETFDMLKDVSVYF